MVKKTGIRRIYLKGNRGFTLMELLVALFIIAAITGVMTVTIITMISVGPKNNAQAIVFTQVQDAGIFISRDAMMADNVTTRPSNDFLSLYWTDPEDNVHYIDYVIVDSVLKRQTSEGEDTQVAEYIELYPNTSAEFVPGDNMTKPKLNVTIKSTFGNAETQRTYTITPRRM
ncbi:MAG: type II secretion system protein J [Promethearchaeota archaeon]